MPFAQDHFPFENKNWQKNNFPAGFVAEYIAQTRTWFYYSLAVSSTLFGHAPFKNIVTTGTLRAEDGQKISKSKKNYPDPWIFIDTYGVDALRMYLMSGPLMKGEDTNFSEKSVQEIASKIIGRLDNVVTFYELYRDKKLENKNSALGSENVLDVWIISRLNQITEEVTTGMKAYDMAFATRPFELFIEDLSTWYVRRSRERIKDGDTDAKQTLYFVLKNLAKLIAPFAPFSAEDIWRRLCIEGDEESVHLCDWIEEGEVNVKIIEEMQKVRDIVSLGLKERQKAGIPVRQPLNKLTVSWFFDTTFSREYEEIIKEELNIKIFEIVKSDNQETTITLDTEITPELKAEGDSRELCRALQDMRKKMGLTPSDVISLFVGTNEKGKGLIEKFENEIKKIVLISKINFTENSGEEIKIDELTFKIKIEK